MRRTLAAVALAVLATGLPVADAKPKPPAIAGITLLAGFGTASVEVTVPKGASLRGWVPAGGAPQFAALGGSGQWAAIALLGHGAQPVRAAQVRTSRPDHCPSQTTPPATPVGRCRKDLHHAALSGATPTLSGEEVRYAIPAGTYQIVLSAPPTDYVVALLLFTGVGGQRGIAATRPAQAMFQRVRAEDMTQAEVSGRFTQKVTRNAVAVVGAWHATSDGENGAYLSAECVTPGNAVGELDAETCAARDVVDPAGAGAGPVLAHAEAGPSTNARIGHTTHLTPVLKPGTYTNSYRVRRTGIGPAAGAFVWWLQADALR